ncbi:hypothetical protein JW851_01900 [Candidatus Woesearchaeota archaeon]|nr:hypothetical protein [Candidatus Woesearchaeota archaeon]
MKNVFIYIAIFVLAIPFALGAQVTLSPAETYESVDADFNVKINNYLGSEVINRVVLNSPDLEIQDVLQFIGWTSDFSSSRVTWSDGTIETNVDSALFVFTANAPLVDQDSTYELSGELRYANLVFEDFKINVTVLNDSSAPVLNDVFPADNGYVRAYKPDQEIRINASDPETGIKSVSYVFSDCYSNSSNVMLSCNNGFCSGNADFSAYGEDDTACFTVTITNNAGDSSVITGSFGFDETPPTVNLLSPVDNSYATNMFRFDVSDNKAAQFECQMEIDNVFVQEVEAFEGTNAFSLEVNVSEEMHDWKVICSDAVGLEGEDQDSFIYDITAPTIVLNSPVNGSAIKDAVIDLTVEDNFEIDSVDYSADLDSSNWPDAWNTLTVTATDKAGNTAVENFEFFVDREAPVIEVISPLNNESFDYHGNFVVKVTDNFDTEIECALSTSVSSPVSQDLTSGEESTIQVALPLGGFTWYMLCVDDIGNSVQSEQMSAVAEDLTGPDIVIEDITYVARGSDLNVQATVTDISSISEVKAVFEGTEKILSANGDVYSGVFNLDSGMVLGDYIVTVYATDSNNQENSAFDEFAVVESYDINVQLSGYSVSPGEEIIVTGSVLRDDSSGVTGIVTVSYPDGSTDASLDDNSEFSYSFTAPANDGDYEVTVGYTVNSLVYKKTVSFSVASPAQQNYGGSSGYGDLSANYNPPSGGTDESSSDTDSIPKPDSSNSELIEETGEEIEEEIPEQEPRVPAITGSVTGIFGNTSAKWLIILLTTVGLVIGSVYGIRKIRKKESGKIDWGPTFD